MQLGTAIVLGEEHSDVSVSETYKSYRYVFQETCFYMEITDKVRFSINNSRFIHLQLLHQTTIEEVLPFFYGTVLTALLHMHYLFPIHASGVISKQGLCLFCAPSGTGKSTLAFNLYKEGLPLFTDDKCVLKWDQVLQRFIATPAISAVRLCQDAMDVMQDISDLKNGVPVIAKKSKYQFNLTNIMYDRPHLVHKIFVIRKFEELKKIKARILKGDEKQKVIRSQMHRPKLVVGEQMKTKFERFTKNLAQRTAVVAVAKPVDIPVDIFVNFMKKRI